MTILKAAPLVFVAAFAPARQPAPAPSIVRAWTYLESAAARLEVVVESWREGPPGALDSAVKSYSEALSKLHLELARLPARKREQRFYKRTLTQLRQQAAQLNKLAEHEQRQRYIALNEAQSHLKGATELVEAKVRRFDSKLIKFEFGVPVPDYTGVIPGVVTKEQPVK